MGRNKDDRFIQEKLLGHHHSYDDTDKCCCHHLFWETDKKRIRSKSSAPLANFAGRISWNPMLSKRLEGSNGILLECGECYGEKSTIALFIIAK